MVRPRRARRGERRRGNIAQCVLFVGITSAFQGTTDKETLFLPTHSLAPTSCSFMWKFALNVLNEQHKCGSRRTCWLKGWWRQCNVLCLLLFLVRYLFIHLLFTYYTSYRRPSHTQCAMLALALPLPACLLLPGCPRVPIHIDMSY